MAGGKAASKEYWDRHPIGVECFDEPVGSPEFYEKYLAYYDDFYDYKWETFQYEKYRDRKVLEIGCGLGIDSVKFAKAGAALTCVDLSNVSVRCTQDLLRQLGLEAAVLQGDAQSLAFPDESFDVVYAYGILMHVEDEARAVREIHRVLRPGGEALIVLYHRRSWYWLLVRLTGTQVESEQGDPPIARTHTLKQARRMFARFPSVDIRLERFPKRTRRRHGVRAFLFNRVLVPFTEALPRAVVRPFGWHMVIKATRE